MSRRSESKATAPVNWPTAAALSTRIGGLMVLAAMGAGCAKAPPVTGPTAKPSPTPQVVEMGRQLYTKQCAVCHGATGAGDGSAAYLLYPKPRDFTQNEFRLVSTTTMQATDEDLFLTITRGMPGSAMPSWEALSPEERWALVYYVRQLTGASAPIDPASVIQVPPETPRTAERVARGREIFAQACASCHGLQGRGDAQVPMVDSQGVPVKPRDLTAGVFKGSSGSKDLYYRIIAGLPGSPMPSYAGVYTDEQVWDLIHYVQSLVPPGLEERVRLRRQILTARTVRGEIPDDPSAELWRDATPVAIALTPLWWRDQRIEGLEVKAVHNGRELAVQLSWEDPTRNDSLLRPQDFSDGVAMQLSAEPNPPFFGMGGLPAAPKASAPSAAQAGDHGAVSIWHWKAAWQEDLAGWRDIEAAYPDAAVDWYQGQRDYRHGEPFEVREAKTASQEPLLMAGWSAENPLSSPQRTSAAEEADARGLGTLTSRPLPVQRVQARGEWREGRWRVVLQRPLASRAGGATSPERSRGTPAEKGDLALRPGQRLSVAFAVWDGQAEDRDGQKSVSVWNILELER